jgi:hypothetical protein
VQKCRWGEIFPLYRIEWLFSRPIK